MLCLLQYIDLLGAKRHSYTAVPATKTPSFDRFAMTEVVEGEYTIYNMYNIYVISICQYIIITYNTPPTHIYIYIHTLII